MTPSRNKTLGLWPGKKIVNAVWRRERHTVPGGSEGLSVFYNVEIQDYGCFDRLFSVTTLAYPFSAVVVHWSDAGIDRNVASVS